jgi:hypothetical protein
MTIKDLLSFDYTGAQPVRVNTNLRTVENCNTVIVTNTGDAIATVNGHVLYPGVPGTSNGDAYVFGGHYGEVWYGNVVCSFGAGANPEVTIDQKFYNNLK